MLNLEWSTPEQSFLHHRVMMDAKKLDKEQLLEIFASVHQQYQLKGHLFSRLVSWCVKNNVELPPFSELLEPKQFDHRDAQEQTQGE
jgi:hypothetical protein